MEAPAAKRMRLDDNDRNSLNTSFRSFLDKIQSPAENDLTKIPWIQILSALLSRFPDMFDEELRSQVLRVLSTLLQATKTVATKKHCLVCCLNLLYLAGLEKGADWELVARTTFNMMSMNQAGSHGHKLFQELQRTHSNLFSLDQVYSLYTNHLVKLSPDTLSTLLFLLRNHPLQTCGRQDARESLVYWLFPDQMEESALAVQFRGHPVDFAQALLSLVLKKARKLLS